MASCAIGQGAMLTGPSSAPPSPLAKYVEWGLEETVPSFGGGAGALAPESAPPTYLNAFFNNACFARARAEGKQRGYENRSVLRLLSWHQIG